VQKITNHILNHIKLAYLGKYHKTVIIFKTHSNHFVKFKLATSILNN